MQPDADAGFEKDPEHISWQEVEEFAKTCKGRFDRVLPILDKWYESRLAISL